ncbi:MAG: Trehalose utilization, partial [Chloroflexota bacterium]
MTANVPKPHVSPRVLLLLGQPDGQITQFHNQPAHWASLGSLLRACDARSRVVTDDIRVLTPESLAKIDVIVNASTALRPSDREYFAIQSRIDAGAGYVGVHVAN